MLIQKFPVYEKSQKLLVINTRKWLLKFKRLEILKDFNTKSVYKILDSSTPAIFSDIYVTTVSKD